MTQGSREEYRAELVSRASDGRSPLLALVLHTGLGLGLVAAALSRITEVRAWELTCVPLFVLLANAVEWHAHRGLLHRRTRFLEALYLRHLPEHHRLFVASDLAVRSLAELRFVLLPIHAVWLVALAGSAFGAGLLLVGGPNLAALWLASAVTYVLLYEWTHLAAHLPAESPIGRLAPVRELRRYHGLHHAPHLMNRWNFNVTAPVWDLVRGTFQRPAPEPARVYTVRLTR